MEPQSSALITGASSGLGAVFAKKLAERRYNLLLVARREKRLTALAAELEQDYPITAEILVADLTVPEELASVEKRVAQLEKLSLLVNNAGFGTTGKFTRIDLSKQADMIRLHIVASVRLSRAALPGMITYECGAIINVSSMAGFIPMPGNVTYCATKAYLNSFSQSLQLELAGTGVQVQALCPGFTYTEFHDTPEFKGYDRSRIPKLMWMSAEEVAESSLRALKQGKVIHIPGWQNRILAGLIYLAPIGLQQWVFSRQNRAVSKLIP